MRTASKSKGTCLLKLFLTWTENVCTTAQCKYIVDHCNPSVSSVMLRFLYCPILTQNCKLSKQHLCSVWQPVMSLETDPWLARSVGLKTCADMRPGTHAEYLRVRIHISHVCPPEPYCIAVPTHHTIGPAAALYELHPRPAEGATRNRFKK